MEKLSTEHLCLAGEYAVASELCRRGIYSQLTLGHHKKTDLLIETEKKMLKIQVKSKQIKEWVRVKGKYEEDDFIILVDFQNKNKTDRPDFYILNYSDFKALVDKEKIEFPELTMDDKLAHPDGWEGLNLRTNDVKTCLEKWDKISIKII